MKLQILLHLLTVYPDHFICDDTRHHFFQSSVNASVLLFVKIEVDLLLVSRFPIFSFYVAKLMGFLNACVSSESFASDSTFMTLDFLLCECK